MLDRRKEYCTK